MTARAVVFYRIHRLQMQIQKQINTLLFFVDKRYISNNSWLSANSVSHNGLHCDTNAIRQPSPYMWPCNNVTMLRCSNTITNICIGPTQYTHLADDCSLHRMNKLRLRTYFYVMVASHLFYGFPFFFVLILHIIFQSKQKLAYHSFYFHFSLTIFFNIIDVTYRKLCTGQRGQASSTMAT